MRERKNEKARYQTHLTQTLLWFSSLSKADKMEGLSEMMYVGVGDIH